MRSGELTFEVKKKMFNEAFLGVCFLEYVKTTLSQISYERCHLQWSSRTHT